MLCCAAGALSVAAAVRLARCDPSARAAAVPKVRRVAVALLLTLGVVLLAQVPRHPPAVPAANNHAAVAALLAHALCSHDATQHPGVTAADTHAGTSSAPRARPTSATATASALP